MPNTMSKLVIFVVMFATFLGQAMAKPSSISCKAFQAPYSLTDFSELSTQKDARLVDDGTDLADSLKVCCDVECCDLGCACAANGCSSAAYISNYIWQQKAFIASETVYFSPFEQPQSIANLLYRPPIYFS